MAMEPWKKRMWGQAFCIIGVVVFLISPLLPYLGFVGLTLMIIGIILSNSKKKNTESKARTENGIDYDAAAFKKRYSKLMRKHITKIRVWDVEEQIALLVDITSAFDCKCLSAAVADLEAVRSGEISKDMVFKCVHDDLETSFRKIAGNMEYYTKNWHAVDTISMERSYVLLDSYVKKYPKDSPEIERIRAYIGCYLQSRFSGARCPFVTKPIKEAASGSVQAKEQTERRNVYTKPVQETETTATQVKPAAPSDGDVSGLTMLGCIYSTHKDRLPGTYYVSVAFGSMRRYFAISRQEYLSAQADKSSFEAFVERLNEHIPADRLLKAERKYADKWEPVFNKPKVDTIDDFALEKSRSENLIPYLESLDTVFVVCLQRTGENVPMIDNNGHAHVFCSWVLAQNYVDYAASKGIKGLFLKVFKLDAFKEYVRSWYRFGICSFQMNARSKFIPCGEIRRDEFVPMDGVKMHDISGSGLANSIIRYIQSDFVANDVPINRMWANTMYSLVCHNLYQCVFMVPFVYEGENLDPVEDKALHPTQTSAKWLTLMEFERQSGEKLPKRDYQNYEAEIEDGSKAYILNKQLLYGSEDYHFAGKEETCPGKCMELRTLMTQDGNHFLCAFTDLLYLKSLFMHTRVALTTYEEILSYLQMQVLTPSGEVTGISGLVINPGPHELRMSPDNIKYAAKEKDEPLKVYVPKTGDAQDENAGEKPSETDENNNQEETGENETKNPVQESKCEAGEIDDPSYIKTINHTRNGKWEQHDVVLDTTIYGWENMYSDASAQITETKYQAAVELMNEGKYEEAISAFKALNRYNDSADQILECQYRKASKLLGEGNYAESAAIFITIKGYKDVDSLLVKDENLSAAAAREAKWQVGNYVTFGTYPQTKEGNDSTPIQWIVLARDGDKALVISKYALDSVRYYSEPYYRYMEFMEFTWVNWGTCSLRTWLNNDFYNKAFSAEEKRNVVLSRVAADKNPKFSTNPGKDTNDNVFLLSIPEVNNYFKDDVSRMCAPTDYAVKNGAFPGSSYKVDGRASCWWWLRSPGGSSDYAAFVNYDGSVYDLGYDVSSSSYCVRPCVWVRLF